MATLLRGLWQAGSTSEVLGEMIECAHNWIRCKATERAQRSELHGVAEVGNEREVGLRRFAGDDLFDGLNAARRADATGGALAAALNGAELEGKPGLARHVDGVVEYHHTAVPNEPIACGKGLVIKGRVEQRARKIGAKRPTHLYRLYRPGRCAAAADFIHQLAERDAKGRLEQTAVFDVPC